MKSEYIGHVWGFLPEYDDPRRKLTENKIEKITNLRKQGEKISLYGHL
jgi:hypothetical protein